MLSSVVIRHLEEHCRQQTSSEQYKVLYLYLDHKETRLQTYSNLIRSLLKQLLLGRQPSDLCNKAQDFYRDSKKGVRPNDSDVFKILQEQISSTLQRVYLIVDALDEYPEEDRAHLFDKLQDICPQKVSLFITSRDFDEINDGHIRCMTCSEENSRYLNIYFKCPECPKFHICQDCNKKKMSCRWRHSLHEPSIVYKEVLVPNSEIKRFVEYVLKRELGVAHLRRGDDQARTGTVGTTRLSKLFPSDPRDAQNLMLNISDAVVRTAEGMFLLAKLHLDSLKLQSNLGALRRSLNNLSAEIGQIYQDLLARIQDQRKGDVALALQALAWVLLAHRPLEVPELLQALAVKRTDIELLREEETDFTIILRVTAGLLIADGEQGAVRVVHRTAQEYFDQHWREIFPDAQSDQAHAMLTYFNFDALSSPCIGGREDQQMFSRLGQYSFLAYASTYWGDHVREVMHDSTIRDAAMNLLKNPSRVAATVQAAWYVGSKNQGKNAWNVREGINAIHLCAWFGLESYIPLLVDHTYDDQIEASDSRLGQTPLMYACTRGHVSAALTLLKLGADPNRVDKKGNNAVFTALLSGHPDLVEYLLTQDLDPPLSLSMKDRDSHTRTAVTLAASHGYTSLLSALLKRPEVNGNLTDSYGDTALTLAAAKSQASTLKTLLEHVDVNVPNAIGSTPLIIAAEKGRDEMVTELLLKGADWRRQNHDGYNAFSKAILHGHTHVVKTLLAHGAGYRDREDSRPTALHIACSSEKTTSDMVELLLHEGLQVNAQSDKRTPLHNASRCGNIAVARTLIKSGADQSIKDSHGRTALVVAWQNGCSDLILLLQEYARRHGLTLGSLPDNSSLPLWSMAKQGHTDLLRAALHTQDIKDHHRDPDTESSALHWAIRSNNLEIAEILLNAGAKTNEVDDHKRTPLHIAAYTTNYEATELLLTFKADPNIENSWGLTPLSIAWSRKDYFTAVRLVEAGAAVESRAAAQDIQETFCAAVQIGVLSVAKTLNNRGEVDLEARNAQGQTIVELANASGDAELVEWVRQLLYRRI